MFMLLERAEGLADRINRYDNLKAAAKQADLYRTRDQQLEQAGLALREARTAIERFLASGIPVDFVALHADSLIDMANKLADPIVLADPPFNLKYEFTDRLLSMG